MKLILSCSILFLCSLLVNTSNAKKRSNKWIKLKKSSFFSYSLSRVKVHPSRYIITNGIYSITSGDTFDLQTGKFKRLPVLVKAVGFPVAPSLGGVFSVQRRKSELAGKFWKWGTSKVVYYDRVKGVAGLWARKEIYKKHIKGAPYCPCGSKSTLVKTDYLYHCYCKGYRKALPVKSYIKKSTHQYYFHINVVNNKVLWKTMIGKGEYSFIGVDSGQYLYAGLSRFKNNKNIYISPGGIIRLNLTTRKTDWTKSLKFPNRKKGYGPYSIQYRASPDFKFFWVWEFDEKVRNSNHGWLKSPYPQGYVVSRLKNSALKIEAPVEIWTSSFDQKSTYLYINSYQKGEITRVNLKTNKIKTVKRVKNTFHSAITPESKYLYNFHLKGITVYKIPSLKKVKFISKKSYLGKGNTTSGVWYNLNSNRNVLIGIWKKRKISPSGHINPRYPFSVFKLLK